MISKNSVSQITPLHRFTTVILIMPYLQKLTFALKLNFLSIVSFCIRQSVEVDSLSLNSSV